MVKNRFWIWNKNKTVLRRRPFRVFPGEKPLRGWLMRITKHTGYGNIGNTYKVEILAKGIPVAFPRQISHPYLVQGITKARKVAIAVAGAIEKELRKTKRKRFREALKKKAKLKKKRRR